MADQTRPCDEYVKVRVQKVMDSPSKVLHAIAYARNRRAIIPKFPSFDDLSHGVGPFRNRML